MKRYLLFAGEDYYPQGGMHDFLDSYDNTEDAKQAYIDFIKTKTGYYDDWGHIYDTEKSEIVISFSRKKMKEGNPTEWWDWEEDFDELDIEYENIQP